MPTHRRKRQGQSGDDDRRRKVTEQNAESIIPQTILKILKTQKQVSADDVHDRLAIPPHCMKFVAHAFRGLQAQGLIRIVKIVNTPRDGQHGNRIAIWELVPQLVPQQ